MENLKTYKVPYGAQLFVMRAEINTPEGFEVVDILRVLKGSEDAKSIADFSNTIPSQITGEINVMFNATVQVDGAEFTVNLNGDPIIDNFGSLYFRTPDFGAEEIQSEK